MYINSNTLRCYNSGTRRYNILKYNYPNTWIYYNYSNTCIYNYSNTYMIYIFF